jgi:hypothetical protein
MQVDAVLGRLVVVGADGEDGVGAHVGRLHGEVDGLPGAVAAGPGNDLCLLRWSMTILMTLRCSSRLRQAASPVEPQGRSMSTPFSSWKSTSLLRASSSTVPSLLKGVTNAVPVPLNLLLSAYMSILSEMLLQD